MRTAPVKRWSGCSSSGKARTFVVALAEDRTEVRLGSFSLCGRVLTLSPETWWGATSLAGFGGAWCNEHWKREQAVCVRCYRQPRHCCKRERLCQQQKLRKQHSLLAQQEPRLALQRILSVAALGAGPKSTL